MAEPLITDHTFRAGMYSGTHNVRERDRCAWNGTCRRPAAEHEASTWPKYGCRAKPRDEPQETP